MIPPEGIRITDLARRADMTKQALGEFMVWLEQASFVASGRAPADGRVRLITRTEQGDVAAIEAERAIDVVERGWRTEIGAVRDDAMKQVLRQLGRDQIG
jgi:DNA-binding MarR family transcriptional regulator